ncbi:MAG: sialidase family protein [Acidimicrobiia bacterium]
MIDSDGIRVGEPSVVVASGRLPLSRANNNVDVADLEGVRHLAWRSGPWHWASRKARIHLASSVDGGHTWHHDHTVALDRDVREPRLFVFDGRLHLFFFTAGTDWRRFQPDRIHVAVRRGRRWSEPVPVSGVDHVLWRVRWLGATPLMTVYRGAGLLGPANLVPPTVELWTTDDGTRWYPRPDMEPPSATGTETDIIRMDDGTLVGVTRRDGPHEYGSAVSAQRPGQQSWETRHIPMKLDSPLLFGHDGEVLLIARRSLGCGGRFDLNLRLREPARMRFYEGVYAATRKRTSLWRVDPETLDVELLADLPGHGDTCFPALVHEGDGIFRLYNYTSPLNGPDRAWITGLVGRTEIYQAELRIERRIRPFGFDASSSGTSGFRSAGPEPSRSPVR